MSKYLLATGPTYWMPTQASTFARELDWVFMFIMWVCVVFFVVIAGAMFYFMIRYRRRGPHDQVSRITHNTPLEVTWSVAPSFLLVMMFWWGFDAFMVTRTTPAGAYEIKVQAVRWKWTFVYPNGGDSDELHVPPGRPIVLKMNSSDVLHSLFVPAFRCKRDVVPGRTSDVWFQSDKPGTYPLFCAEYCGKDHSDMRTVAVVHNDQAEFDAWLDTNDPLKLLTDEQYAEYRADYDAFMLKYKNDPTMAKILPKLLKPVEMGKRFYDKKGCISCHTLDGKASTGPTWKGVFGREEELSDGSTIKVDENYLRESITVPTAKTVKGFQAGAMSAWRGTDREVELLIEFIKTVK